MRVGNEKSEKRKEEGGFEIFLGSKLGRNTGMQAGKRAGVGILGLKLKEKRFEEVTRERFCERIEMGVSS